MRSRPAVFVALALSLAACSKQRNHEERRLPDGSTLLECELSLRGCLAEAERLCRDESFTVLGANHVVRHYGADAGESKVVLTSSSARVRCLSRGAEPPSLTPEERPRDAACQVEHLGRRVHPHKAPVRLRLGERLELEAPTGADDQDVGGLRRMFRQQKHRHAMKVGETGHLSRSVIGVAGDRRGIGEGLHWVHGCA